MRDLPETILHLRRVAWHVPWAVSHLPGAMPHLPGAEFLLGKSCQSCFCMAPPVQVIVLSVTPAHKLFQVIIAFPGNATAMHVRTTIAVCSCVSRPVVKK